jgi:hypothetical protein
VSRGHLGQALLNRGALPDGNVIEVVEQCAEPVGVLSPFAKFLDRPVHPSKAVPLDQHRLGAGNCAEDATLEPLANRRLRDS